MAKNLISSNILIAAHFLEGFTGKDVNRLGTLKGT